MKTKQCLEGIEDSTEALVKKGLAIDFGWVDGKRTVDRAPEWFLMPEHRHYSYEWYLTGQGSPFRHRRGRCAKMAVPERLGLALELLDMPEVQLWAELGWNVEAINLAALKSGRLRLSDDQLTAIATNLGVSITWLRTGTGRIMDLV